ncbi:MAG: hypothetical protein QME68_00725 [Elusimicrobiota bacterium]|nr:hypothetical protein [Elusimicrobiota bacterium]
MKTDKEFIKIFLIGATIISALFTNGFSIVNISTYVVDGVHNNPEVVVYNRQPIFSWEYTGEVSSFTVSVSTESSLPFNTTTWIINSSTNTQNTTVLDITNNKYRTFITYNSNNSAKPLTPNNTYYWNLVLYDISGASYTIPTPPTVGKFITVISSITLAAPNYDLQVDWNNPFNPDSGQVTKFRYILKGTTDIKKKVKVRIYTLTGEYVTTPKHYAPISDDDPNWYEILPNREYTAEWDGRDETGEKVPAGLYLVNLTVYGEPKGITKIVVAKRSK